MTGDTPFAFRPGRCIIRRAPALLKLLALLCLSALAFSGARGLALCAFFLVLFCALARVNPLSLLRGSAPLMIFAAFALISGAINFDGPKISAEGLLKGALAALRIFTIFSLAGFFFAVTSLRDLRKSISTIENKIIKIFFPKRKERGVLFFSLGLSLMLGFIPRFFEAWETAELSCRARSCRKGLRRLKIIVPLVTEIMIEKAALTALALEARGLEALALKARGLKARRLRLSPSRKGRP